VGHRTFGRLPMSDRKKSWREIDRGRDRSAHRSESGGPKGRPARVESASAAYKQKLNAFFDRGVIPDHLKDKVPQGESEGPSERQKFIRAIRDAKNARALETAVDALDKEYGLPNDPEVLLRVLEHSDDGILFKAVSLIEAHVETGMPLPRKKLFVQRLKGLEFSSFDPRVQRKAIGLASRLG
jgi:hypothetical protein